MSDSTITIILVTCVIVLMFFFPFLFITAQQDTIDANEVKTITESFVNSVAKEGKITQNNYDEFKSKLNATGNKYTIELEAQKCNNYPYDSAKAYYVIGKNMYYSEFTNIIENEIYENGEYGLKKGDYIKVKVENRNYTLATQLKKIVFGLAGKDYSEIYANISELVVATTQRDGVDPSVMKLTDLEWKWDYYWEDENLWPTSETYWRNSEEFEVNLKRNAINMMSVTKTDNHSISKIKIDDYRVQMVGNNIYPGKGACWATTEVPLTEVQFDYNVFKRR